MENKSEIEGEYPDTPDGPESVLSYHVIVDEDGDRDTHGTLDAWAGVCTLEGDHECDGFIELFSLVHDEETDEMCSFVFALAKAEAVLLVARLTEAIAEA
ncbi:MAG: hypothetical protein M3P18_02750 [Actinomycetota bacterium]|nr:hypothetical protein [Actinomycetota bacterium]